MSNIYVTEPPTSGRIILSTSKGEIEIELWSKEAPQACRNIVGLALEGALDRCLWHRVVPGFCVQTGDPTGSGAGGTSFFGEPFPIEPHSRLRFTRRGLVAMAADDSGMNESQFFITLADTPELNGKFTIFGRVAGPTIYNVLSLAEVELSQTEPDRPVYPPKLHSVRVVENPFDDVVPRITREEREEQEQARREALARRGEERDRKKVKKNTALLSFGEAEEGLADDPTSQLYKGAKSSHDLLQNDKRLRREVAAEEAPSPLSTSLGGARGKSASNGDGAGEDGQARKKRKKGEKEESGEVDLATLREQHALSKEKDGAASKIRELEASIRGLSRRGAEDRSASPEAKKKLKRGRALLDEARAKYAKASAASSSSSAKGKSRTAEKGDDTLALLSTFQTKMRGEREEGREGKRRREGKSKSKSKEVEVGEEIPPEAREYGAGESDEDEDDKGWMSHRLDFGGRSISTKEDKYAVEDYEVLDPRDPSNGARAALGFKGSGEEESKKEGKRGRDWVEERRWDKESKKEGGRAPRGDRDREKEKEGWGRDERDRDRPQHHQRRGERGGAEERPEWGRKAGERDRRSGGGGGRGGEGGSGGSYRDRDTERRGGW